MTRVLIAGGNKDVLQDFRRKLKEYGAEVAYAWPRKPKKHLPGDIDAVLLISNMATIGLRNQVASMAKTSGLPLVRMTNKFSSFDEVLKRVLGEEADEPEALPEYWSCKREGDEATSYYGIYFSGVRVANANDIEGVHRWLSYNRERTEQMFDGKL